VFDQENGGLEMEISSRGCAGKAPIQGLDGFLILVQGVQNLGAQEEVVPGALVGRDLIYLCQPGLRTGGVKDGDSQIEAGFSVRRISGDDGLQEFACWSVLLILEQGFSGFGKELPVGDQRSNLAKGLKRLGRFSFLQERLPEAQFQTRVPRIGSNHPRKVRHIPGALLGCRHAEVLEQAGVRTPADLFRAELPEPLQHCCGLLLPARSGKGTAVVHEDLGSPKAIVPTDRACCGSAGTFESKPASSFLQVGASVS